MTLQQALSTAKTEEGVKDAYNKGLVDIQTEELWFETKEAPTAPILLKELVAGIASPVTHSYKDVSSLRGVVNGTFSS